ncbi:fibronectin type III domain-containing protein [Hymenobacter koreensis]|uniref:Fibronectin type-III domain-containing protein n=1 Tax=Hymenobacter koreensis TaxID=1084523 RepID=A0ABP8J4V5_9BACT
MKTIILFALLSSGTLLQAQAQQPISLNAARTAGPGATVTVRGVVTNGPELGNIRYVQDKDGGLAAFSNKLPGFTDLVPGDSVELNGTLKNYNSLLEMDPVISFKKLGRGRPVQPKVVPAADVAKVLNEANEGRLVKLTGVKRLTTMGGSPVTTIAGNFNYLIDGQGGALARVSVSSEGPNGLVGKEVPTGEFDLIGIVGQHSPTGTPTGYQLLPRLVTDMVQGGGMPVIVGEPVPISVSKSTITVRFETLNPGTTKIEYGATPALGGMVNDATPTKLHSMELTDLQPGTTYYVRVSSTNSVGTSTSEAVPMITSTKNRTR